MRKCQCGRVRGYIGTRASASSASRLPCQPDINGQEKEGLPPRSKSQAPRESYLQQGRKNDVAALGSHGEENAMFAMCK